MFLALRPEEVRLQRRTVRWEGQRLSSHLRKHLPFISEVSGKIILEKAPAFSSPVVVPGCRRENHGLNNASASRPIPSRTNSVFAKTLSYLQCARAILCLP
jgi:hypothetical protein